MKRNKVRNIFKILILIVVLAFLSIYYLLRQIPETKNNESHGKVQIVQNIPEFKIEGFDITYNNGTNIYRTLIEKISNEWAVSFPAKDRADEESVRRIINGLGGLRSEYFITNGEGKLHDFGFDNPVCRIKVLLNNEKNREIIVGGKAATEDMYYAITGEDSNTVYMVYGYKFNSVMKTSDDFRSREIFTIPIQDLKEFDIRAADEKLYSFKVFYTNGQQFFLTSPRQLPVQDFSVKSKIMDIYSISISGFIKNNAVGSDLKLHGLNKPLFSARFLSKNNITNELYIGNRDKEGFYYSYIPQKRVLITVEDEELTNKFKISIEDLTNKINE